MLADNMFRVLSIRHRTYVIGQQCFFTNNLCHVSFAPHIFLMLLDTFSAVGDCFGFLLWCFDYRSQTRPYYMQCVSLFLIISAISFTCFSFAFLLINDVCLVFNYIFPNCFFFKFIAFFLSRSLIVYN